MKPIADRPPEPHQREAEARQQQQPGRGGEQRGHLDVLGLHRPFQVDRVVHRRRALRVGAPRSSGRPSGRRSRATVGSSSAVASWNPSTSSTVPCRAADADRVDPHSRARRQFGDVDRVRFGGVLAVGEQDDRRRAVVAEVRALRLDSAGSTRTPGASTSTGFPTMALSDGLQAAAQRRAALRAGGGRSRRARRPVRGRLLGDQPAGAERDDADPHGRRLALDERCVRRPSRRPSASA